MAHAATAAADARNVAGKTGRPMERLPLRQLYQLSIYWLGINAVWGGLNIALQEIVPPLTPAGESGRFLALLDIFAIGEPAVLHPFHQTFPNYGKFGFPIDHDKAFHPRPAKDEIEIIFRARRQ